MELLRLVLIGLGVGATYALIAQGLVLVHRGSGVLNFAQGAFVMVGAFTYYEVVVGRGLPGWLGLAAAVLIGAIVGALVQLVVLRHMKESSALFRVIATLAVMLALTSLATLLYGSDLKSVPAVLPTRSVSIVSGISLGADRIVLFFLAVLSTGVLWWAYRRTAFGRATSAVAENELVVASLGYSPDRIALVNWAIGSAISALTGALIAPVTYVQAQTLAMLIIPALAVGLIANFKSFPLVLMGAMILGVLESAVARYVTAPGWAASAPFIVVVAVMLIRGRGIPLRSHVLDRLPEVGTGMVRAVPVLVTSAAAGTLLVFVLSPTWVTAFTVTMAFAILCLSVVVITGFAGQLSLAQYVLSGLGALIAARLMADHGWPLLLATIGALTVTALAGLLVALPALRTRGINLAIVTLGLGVVIYNIILSNPDYSGGVGGVVIPEPTIFGWGISGLIYPERYAMVALVALVVVALVVLNLRRGSVGRRMLAVRSNERAAAALGVGVFSTKLYAFAIASAIAGLAGIVLTFRSFSVVTMNFDVFTSVSTVAMTVVGGVGYVGGGLVGGILMPSGAGAELFAGLEGSDRWLPLISSLLLLFILVREPSGLWQLNVEMVRSLGRLLGWQRLSRLAERRQRQGAAPLVPPDEVHEVEPRRLVVDGLDVAFGQVRAVRSVSLTVEPGSVHGLIGPNGAGKTTLIDALTGFVKPRAGTVTLGDRKLNRTSPQQRLRAGLGRSFQSLELFEDLTLRENLAIASETWSSHKYATDSLMPGKIVLNDAATAAALEFGLEDALDLRPGQLSMGKRRLAAIARAVASRPSILCLDEPAAGLSDPEAEHLGILLRKLARDWGIGILLVEHNIELVLSTCDVVTVLAEGALLVEGSPDKIRHDPQVLTAYLGEKHDGPEGASEPADEESIAELT